QGLRARRRWVCGVPTRAAGARAEPLTPRAPPAPFPRCGSERRAARKPGADDARDRLYVAGERRADPEPWPCVASGTGITGRASAQKIISPPTTSMARPVHRLTLIPEALFLTSSLPTMPTIARITP